MGMCEVNVFEHSPEPPITLNVTGSPNNAFWMTRCIRALLPVCNRVLLSVKLPCFLANVSPGPNTGQKSNGLGSSSVTLRKLVGLRSEPPFHMSRCRALAAAESGSAWGTTRREKRTTKQKKARRSQMRWVTPSVLRPRRPTGLSASEPILFAAVRRGEGERRSSSGSGASAGREMGAEMCATLAAGRRCIASDAWHESFPWRGPWQASTAASPSPDIPARIYCSWRVHTRTRGIHRTYFTILSPSSSREKELSHQSEAERDARKAPVKEDALPSNPSSIAGHDLGWQNI
jgi:hypothetical protein